MMDRFRTLKVFGFGLILLSVGCATPAHRIKKNPELFNSFPPEAREAIEQGRAEIGFTPPMVEMALGPADRVIQRKMEEKTQEIWSYLFHDIQYVPGYTYYGRSRYDRCGRRRWVHVPTQYRQIESREILRVVFEQDKVASIEQAVK
ncbi:MAG: hypothetical protein AAF492_00525 [Verrucomicrobiota bacterium]